MAVALNVASPYALKYTEIASGSGTDNTLTRAQMLADAQEGPLKAKLLQADTGVKWTALLDDPAISVHVSGLGGTPALVGYGFGNPGSPAVSTLQLTAAAAGNAMVEIRYNHTLDR